MEQERIETSDADFAQMIADWLAEDTLPEEAAVICDYCGDSGAVCFNGIETICPYCGE